MKFWLLIVTTLLLSACATPTYSGYCEPLPGWKMPVKNAKVTTAKDGQIIIVDKHQWTKSEPQLCSLERDH